MSGRYGMSRDFFFLFCDKTQIPGKTVFTDNESAPSVKKTAQNRVQLFKTCILKPKRAGKSGLCDITMGS